MSDIRNKGLHHIGSVWRLPGIVEELAVAKCQEVRISIETIERDQFISGRVQGLEAEEIPRHRVVVYIHTDMWYIHPFAGQGEGLSWAAIRPDFSPHAKVGVSGKVRSILAADMFLFLFAIYPSREQAGVSPT